VIYEHLVAHAVRKARPFAEPEPAWWLWRRLRHAFPSAIAACLMPDHVHIVVNRRGHGGSEGSVRLAKVLSGQTRRLRVPHLWEPVEGAPIRDREKLLRQVRYVHLNPCRARLVDDPLRWPWSTHRGAIGAEHDAWVTASRLCRVFEGAEAGFAEWFHNYVSSDPAVAVTGTTFPMLAGRRDVPSIPLDTILAASVAATPWERPTGFRTVRLRLAISLAWHQGWRDCRLVAHAVGASVDGTRRLAKQHDGALLRSGQLCLGDRRLRFNEPVARALLCLQAPRRSGRRRGV
jgi:hypothetical protein